MKVELLVIVGMPGSGKTTYIKQLVKSGDITDYCDDYEFNHAANEDKRLLVGLRKGEKWAIADTRYCNKIERVKLQKFLQKLIPNLKLKFIYFENRPELCKHNSDLRKGELADHEHVINLIYYYTKIYDIPKDAEVIKIYRARAAKHALKPAKFLS